MRHVWALALLLAGCASMVSVVPLPSDVKIVAPTSVPAERAAFSGKWQGVWDGQLDHILVVEELTGDRAKVIYAWGDSAAWYISRGFQRYEGTFDGNVLVVKTQRPATAKYRLRRDGKLDASYEWQGGTVLAILTRVTENK